MKNFAQSFLMTFVTSKLFTLVLSVSAFFHSRVNVKTLKDGVIPQNHCIHLVANINGTKPATFTVVSSKF